MVDWCNASPAASDIVNLDVDKTDNCLGQEEGDAGTSAKDEEKNIPEEGEDLFDSVFGQLPGTIFPSMTLREMYSPAMLTWMVAYAASRGVEMCMPSGTIFVGIASYNVPVFTLSGIPAVYFWASASLASRRLSLSAFVLYLSLSCLDIFLGYPSLSFVATLLLSASFGIKSIKRPKAAWAAILIVGVTNFVMYVVTLNMGQLLEKMPSDVIRGLVPSILGTLTGFIGLQTFRLVLSCFLKPGIPAELGFGFIGLGTIFGDAVRLAGFVVAEGKAFQLATGAVSMMVCEVVARMPISQRVLGTKISPVRDLYLRIRFILSYLPLIVGGTVMAFIVAAGPHWARKPGPWIGFAVFLLCSLASDLIVVLIHRRLVAPPTDESLLGTMMKLSTTPRTNYPMYQLTEAPLDPAKLFAPSSMSFGRVCTDKFYVRVLVCWGVFISLYAALVGAHTECSIIKHADLCATLA